MEQSDFMIYTDIATLQFKDKRTNDLAYLYQMSRTTPRCLVDRGQEKLMQQGDDKRMCNKFINGRGGNYPGCEPTRSCPHPEYSRYYMNEFLLVPCAKPTYKNYIRCDDVKCCSIQHQLFNNWTKRKL